MRSVLRGWLTDFKHTKPESCPHSY